MKKWVLILQWVAVAWLAAACSTGGWAWRREPGAKDGYAHRKGDSRRRKSDQGRGGGDRQHDDPRVLLDRKFGRAG